MCSSCFSLETLRYALAACKFLFHSNEKSRYNVHKKSRYNVHIKQEGPVALAGGALIEFLGFGETRSTPSCSCSLYIIPETKLATELPLISGLLFFLPRHFAYFKEDSPCFPVKFGSQRNCSLSFLDAGYFISTWGSWFYKLDMMPGFSRLNLIRARRHCLPTGTCERTPQCLWFPLCSQILLLMTSSRTHTTSMTPELHSAALQVLPRERSPASGIIPLVQPSPHCLQLCSPDWLFLSGQSSPRFSKDIPLVHQYWLFMCHLVEVLPHSSLQQESVGGVGIGTRCACENKN